MQTVRFDDADGLTLDQSKSRGVLGFTRHTSGAMYVALDPAVEQAVVTLAALTAGDRAEKTAGNAEPSLPVKANSAPVVPPDAAKATTAATAVQSLPAGQLISSRWWFRGYEPAGCGFNITASGFGAGDMLWQTEPSRKFDVIAERDGRELARISSAADQAGVLQLTVKADAIEPLKLRFVCNE